MQKERFFSQSCGGSTFWPSATLTWWIIRSFGCRDTDGCGVLQQWHIFFLFMYKMECFGLGWNRLFHWMLWFWKSLNRNTFRPVTQTWNQQISLLFSLSLSLNLFSRTLRFDPSVQTKKQVAERMFLWAPFVNSQKLLQWNKNPNTKTTWVFCLHKLLHVLARWVFLLEHVLDEWWRLYFRPFYKYCSSEITRLFIVCLRIKRLLVHTWCLLEFYELSPFVLVIKDFCGVGTNRVLSLRELFLVCDDNVGYKKKCIFHS